DELIVPARDCERAVTPGDFFGQDRYQHWVGRPRLEVDERDAEMVGEDPAELEAGDRADLDQRVAHALPGRALERERVVELLHRDQAAVDHGLADAAEPAA